MRIFFILLCFHLLCNSSVSGQRQRLLLDRGWRFSFGHSANPEKDFNYGIRTVFSKSGGVAGTAMDARFNDSSWRSLDLPHDWAVELPFVQVDNPDLTSHGYKPVGGLFPETSIGWYRKRFSVNRADSGRRFQLQFDGVFRDAEFWVNGFYLGNNKSGYVGVEYDITDFLHFDRENLIVVRVDATQYEGWFYEGAGIYRHVWLNSYPNTHIATHGVFAYASFSGNKAKLSVETELVNADTESSEITISSYVTDRAGKPVATAKPMNLRLSPEEKKRAIQIISLDNPRRWSVEDPYLHRVVVEIRKKGQLTDRQVLRFGFRTIEIKTNGVFLNGKHIKLKGTNNHQDHAGVGSALPDYLQYYRISLLKNMGSNAYRASHNAPTPELLDACDSLGMLVLSEQRLLNSGAEYMDQFERLVRRDRSRTSVFMWVIGNEEGWIHTNTQGKRITETYLRKLSQWDPSRTATYAADLPNVFNGINEVIPVRSFNYRQFAVADYHRDHPQQPILGTEMGSTVTTRGILEVDSVRAYLPDQDITAPWWASTAEAWWSLAAPNDYWLGGFVWTGFDYRGEPTPFRWPNINSHFGIMDMCGFPKNIYYYYQSWWTDKDVLHISPHWNWPDKRGQTIKVWVNSNADSVELVLNGKSLGMKTMQRNSHLEWMVTYEPGKLEAIGWKKGKRLHTMVQTTGRPVELVMTPYKTTLLADGRDVSVINISVVDENGNEVPDADNRIRFYLEGDAKIIGVGNGDPSSHEPDQCMDGAWQRSLFNGKCQLIVQAGDSAGIIKLEAKAAGLRTAGTDIVAVSAASAQTITIDPKYELKGEAAKPRPVGKMLGADISFLPQLEARGIRFSDKGVENDAIAILKDHGFNYIRLRIFHSPAREGGYSPGRGFCDLDHTLRMAKRVKQAGLKLLLDFHYSDYWADPGKQFKPKAWEGLSFEALKDSLYQYTRRVMLALEAQGTTPDMVQVGNEINHGLVWPEGNVMYVDQTAQLIAAGTAAVKEVDPTVQMMLHVALGGQHHESVFFIDHMLARGVHFDVIGQSYYPKWHGTLADLEHNLTDLVKRYNKDLILVEYSALKREVNEISFNLPDLRGKGTCIWEPLNTWEKIFDEKGTSNERILIYDELAKRFL